MKLTVNPNATNPFGRKSKKNLCSLELGKYFQGAQESLELLYMCLWLDCGGVSMMYTCQPLVT